MALLGLLRQASDVRAITTRGCRVRLVAAQPPFEDLDASQQLARHDGVGVAYAEVAPQPRRSGDDTLRGGNEGDGGNVNDVLEGGFGDDTLLGGRGVDDLDGGPENDKLDGGDDRDRLDGGLGTDTIDGGVASSNGFFTGDTVVYDRVNPVQVDLHRTDGSQDATGENDKIVRVENAQGGHGDDKLTGAENNILVGGRGDGVLKGEAGRDALHGLENETI